MGREIRRVPPNWDHPKVTRSNGKEGYQPMRNYDAETAWDVWQEEFRIWCESEGDKVRDKYGSGNYPKDEPYRAFCAWHGNPPDPKYYFPKFKEEPTWYQVYETVSEGTPVTPPFETQHELVEYLVANGDFWDQKRRAEGITSMNCDPWDRQQATQFVFGSGWAPSMVVSTTSEGSTIATAGHGFPS